jgi:CRISPR/Cas system CMR subunit Cmr6 (Cas7 group RAMP superfamily)
MKTEKEPIFLKVVLAIVVVWLFIDFLRYCREIQKKLPDIEKQRNEEYQARVKKQEGVMKDVLELEVYSQEELENLFP